VSGNLYALRKLKATINNLPVNLTGQIADNNTGMVLNLSLRGEELDIQSALSLLPEEDRKKFEDYKSSGLIYLEASVKGKLSRTENPLVEASFGISGGDIEQASSGIRLENVFLKGKYQSGKQGENEYPTSAARSKKDLSRGILCC
jgi:hypothetical protein